MNQEKIEKLKTQIAECIVIDYANLSGRESANRAEFRQLVLNHLHALTLALLEPEEKTIIICGKHGNKALGIPPPHYCEYKIREACSCICTCDDTPREPEEKEKKKETCQRIYRGKPCSERASCLGKGGCGKYLGKMPS